MTTFLTRFFSLLLLLLLLIHMLDTCLALLNVMAMYAIAMPCVRVQNLPAHVATPMKIHFVSQCYQSYLMCIVAIFLTASLRVFVWL